MYLSTSNPPPVAGSQSDCPDQSSETSVKRSSKSLVVQSAGSLKIKATVPKRPFKVPHRKVSVVLNHYAPLASSSPEHAKRFSAEAPPRSRGWHSRSYTKFSGKIVVRKAVYDRALRRARIDDPFINPPDPLQEPQFHKVLCGILYSRGDMPRPMNCYNPDALGWILSKFSTPALVHVADVATAFNFSELTSHNGYVHCSHRINDFAMSMFEKGYNITQKDGLLQVTSGNMRAFTNSVRFVLSAAAISVPFGCEVLVRMFKFSSIRMTLPIELHGCIDMIRSDRRLVRLQEIKVPKQGRKFKFRIGHLIKLFNATYEVNEKGALSRDVKMRNICRMFLKVELRRGLLYASRDFVLDKMAKYVRQYMNVPNHQIRTMLYGEVPHQPMPSRNLPDVDGPSPDQVHAQVQSAQRIAATHPVLQNDPQMSSILADLGKLITKTMSPVICAAVGFLVSVIHCILDPCAKTIAFSLTHALIHLGPFLEQVLSQTKDFFVQTFKTIATFAYVAMADYRCPNKLVPPLPWYSRVKFMTDVITVTEGLSDRLTDEMLETVKLEYEYFFEIARDYFQMPQSASLLEIHSNNHYESCLVRIFKTCRTIVMKTDDFVKDDVVRPSTPSSEGSKVSVPEALDTLALAPPVPADKINLTVIPQKFRDAPFVTHDDVDSLHAKAVGFSITSDFIVHDRLEFRSTQFIGEQGPMFQSYVQSLLLPFTLVNDVPVVDGPFVEFYQRSMSVAYVPFNPVPVAVSFQDLRKVPDDTIAICFEELSEGELAVLRKRNDLALPSGAFIRVNRRHVQHIAKQLNPFQQVLLLPVGKMTTESTAFYVALQRGENLTWVCYEPNVTLQEGDNIVVLCWQAITNIIGSIFTTESYDQTKVDRIAKHTRAVHGMISSVKDFFVQVGSMFSSAFKFMYRWLTGVPWECRDYSALYHEITDWKKQALAATIADVDKSSAGIIAMSKLHAKGGELLARVDAFEDRTAYDQIKRALERLNQRQIITNLAVSSVGFRQEPCVVLLRGNAGRGKSLFIETAKKNLQALLWKLTDLSGMVYTHRQSASGRMDNYFGQPITVLDEYFQIRDKTLIAAEIKEIFDFIGTAIMPVEKAALPEKGKYSFMSEFIIVTTNHPENVDLLKTIMSPAAYNRRFFLDVVFDNPDPSDPDTCLFKVDDVVLELDEIIALITHEIARRRRFFNERLESEVRPFITEYDKINSNTFSSKVLSALSLDNDRSFAACKELLLHSSVKRDEFLLYMHEKFPSIDLEKFERFIFQVVSKKIKTGGRQRFGVNDMPFDAVDEPTDVVVPPERIELIPEALRDISRNDVAAMRQAALAAVPQAQISVPTDPSIIVGLFFLSIGILLSSPVFQMCGVLALLYYWCAPRATEIVAHSTKKISDLVAQSSVQIAQVKHGLKLLTQDTQETAAFVKENITLALWHSRVGAIIKSASVLTGCVLGVMAITAGIMAYANARYVPTVSHALPQLKYTSKPAAVDRSVAIVAPGGAIVPQANLDQVNQIVTSSIRDNIAVFKTDLGEAYGLILKNGLVILVNHAERVFYDKVKMSSPKFSFESDGSEWRLFPNTTRDQLYAYHPRIQGKDISKFFLKASEAGYLPPQSIRISPTENTVHDGLIHTWSLNYHDVNVQSKQVTCYAVELPGIAGMCGLPYGVISSNFESRFLFGIHIAGSDGSSFISPVYQEEILAWEAVLPQSTLRLELGDIIEEKLDQTTIFGVEMSEKFTVIGKCKKEFATHLPTRHKIVPSRLQTHLHWVPKTAPAALTPVAQPDGTTLSPLVQAFKKFSNLPMLTTTDEERAWYYDGKYKSLRPTRFLSRSLLNEYEMLNGDDRLHTLGPVDTDTSIGYHPLHKRILPGKNDFITHDEKGKVVFTDLGRHAFYSYVEDILAGRDVTFITDTLKAERRPLEKVKSASTRLFCNLMYETNLVQKMVYGAWAAAAQAARITSPGQVGFSQVDDSCKALWLQIQGVAPQEDLAYLDTDVRQFDYSHTLKDIEYRDKSILKDFYGLHKKSYHYRLAMALMHQMQHAIHICGRMVYRTHGVVLSGEFKTALGNSEDRDFLEKVAIRRILHANNRHWYMTASEMAVKFLSKTYGDDCVTMFNKREFPEVTMEAYGKAMDSIQLGVTTADKKPITSETPFSKEFHFLKRTLVFPEGQPRLALDKDVIEEIPLWHEGGLESLELLVACAQSSISESALHGIEYFDAWSHKLETALATLGVSYPHRTYEQVMAAHHERSSVFRRSATEAERQKLLREVWADAQSSLEKSLDPDLTLSSLVTETNQVLPPPSRPAPNAPIASSSTEPGAPIAKSIGNTNTKTNVPNKRRKIRLNADDGLTPVQLLSRPWLESVQWGFGGYSTLLYSSSISSLLTWRGDSNLKSAITAVYSNFRYIRAVVGAKFTLNRSPALKGALVICVIPPGRVPQSIHEAMQYDFYMLDAASPGDDKEITLPWYPAQRYVDLRDDLGDIMGGFQIWVLDPLDSIMATPPPVHLNITYTLQDIELAGPNTNLGNPDTQSNPFQNVVPVGWIYDDAQAQSTLAPVLDTVSDTLGSLGTEAASLADNTVQESQGSLPGLDMFAVVPTAVDEVGEFVTSLTSEVASLAGCAKPTEVRSQRPTHPTFVGDLPSMKGLTSSVALAPASAYVTNRNSHSLTEAPAISAIAAKPSFVDRFSYSNDTLVGERLWYKKVSPSIPLTNFDDATNVNQLLMTHCGWTADLFRYYHGAMDYWFYFHTNSMISGKVAVVISRNPLPTTLTNFSGQITRFIDVNRRSMYRTRVPYLAQEDWMSTHCYAANLPGGQPTVMGYIGVYCVRPLVSSQATENITINASVFVSYQGDFTCPKGPIIGDTEVPAALRRPAEPQWPKGEALHDSIDSLRTYFHRFTLAGETIETTTYPGQVQTSWDNLVSDHWFRASKFHFWRGTTHYKLMRDFTADTSAVPNGLIGVILGPEIAAASSTRTTGTSSGTLLADERLNPVLEFSVPYYTNVPYLSVPTTYSFEDRDAITFRLFTSNGMDLRMWLSLGDDFNLFCLGSSPILSFDPAGLVIRPKKTSAKVVISEDPRTSKKVATSSKPNSLPFVRT